MMGKGENNSCEKWKEITTLRTNTTTEVVMMMMMMMKVSLSFFFEDVPNLKESTNNYYNGR